MVKIKIKRDNVLNTPYYLQSNLMEIINIMETDKKETEEHIKIINKAKAGDKYMLKILNNILEEAKEVYMSTLN